MEQYYASLINKLNDKNDETTNPLDDNNNDNIFDDETTNPLDDNNDDSSLIGSIIDMKKPIPDDDGTDYKTPIIVYSFIKDVELIKTLKQKLNIFDLTEEFTKIVFTVHKGLPNEYASSEKITENIMKSIETFINSKLNENTIFFLPVLSQASSFNIDSQLNTLKKFKIVFINPILDLILQQIEENYHTSPYRLTLNQDINYILKQYKQYKPEMNSKQESHKIEYNKEDFKKLFERIKSAFVDENDFSSFLEEFDHHLIYHNIPQLEIIHKLCLNPPNIKSFTIHDLKEINESSIDMLIQVINNQDKEDKQ